MIKIVFVIEHLTKDKRWGIEENFTRISI